MIITKADIESLASVYRRAADHWYVYFQSGHGPADFENRQAWLAHVSQVESDLSRVRKFLNKMRSEA